MAYDRILLLLNRRRDGLHLVCPLPGERVDEERVRQGDLRIEKGVQVVFA